MESEGSIVVDDPTPELHQIKVEGKVFRCKCGANVFRHQPAGDIFTCNGCGAEYTGDGLREPGGPDVAKPGTVVDPLLGARPTSHRLEEARSDVQFHSRWPDSHGGMYYAARDFLAAIEYAVKELEYAAEAEPLRARETARELLGYLRGD